MFRKSFTALVGALLLVIATRTDSAQAQLQTPRLGISLNTLLSSEDGLGLGFRGRLASPINSDLSLAFDTGISGFIFEGQDQATWVVDPQVSLIVTLEGQTRAPYLLAGLGGYIPFGDGSTSEGGPSIHMGVGWVKLLRESTLFYELVPALVVGEETTSVAIPFRIGIIF